MRLERWGCWIKGISRITLRCIRATFYLKHVARVQRSAIRDSLT